VEPCLECRGALGLVLSASAHADCPNFEGKFRYNFSQEFPTLPNGKVRQPEIRTVVIFQDACNQVKFIPGDEPQTGMGNANQARVFIPDGEIHFTKENNDNGTDLYVAHFSGDELIIQVLNDYYDAQSGKMKRFIETETYKKNEDGSFNETLVVGELSPKVIVFSRPH
jgi:hypothetical protein